MIEVDNVFTLEMREAQAYRLWCLSYQHEAGSRLVGPVKFTYLFPEEWQATFRERFDVELDREVEPNE